MSTDAFEMALVHRVFRDALEYSPQLIGSVRPGQRKRRRFVASHIANILAALHHYHLAEDELVWPILRTRAPLRAEDIHCMETEHAVVAKLADSVGLRLAAWIAATDSTAENIAARPMATETLIFELEALAELVGDHLSAEEERVLPVINQYLTDAEWRAVTERASSFLNSRRMWFGLHSPV